MDVLTEHEKLPTLNTIVVVAICSVPQLRRSLMSLLSQTGFASCETIVAADPRIGSLREIAKEFPEIRFLSRAGCDTPVDLTTMALQVARGERVILTEDSCVASPGWLSALLHEPSEGKGAVGGSVEATEGISLAMWSFCYVDFFRYMHPLKAGHTPTLSVCNIAYRRADLEAISDRWTNGFNENEINNLLQDRVGPLWLNPAAEVRVRRDVKFFDAVYERYAFGRLFGATRISHSDAKRRMYFAAVAPALPFVLMARMASKAFNDAGLFKRFLASSPIILLMVLAWSWGEWLGYVTARRPKRITTAPERDLTRGLAGERKEEEPTRFGPEWS
jgi:hypothetical protein